MICWRNAQQVEEKSWTVYSADALDELRRWKTEVVVPEIIRWVEDSLGEGIQISQSTILQIGCAAVGTIYFFPITAKRFAVEPLADSFKRHFPEYVDPRVNLTKAVGEQLPYKDETFNLVLLENVIDHCYQPRSVVQEVYRVLQKSGAVYVSVDFCPSISKLAHQFMEQLKLPFRDTAHPYHFDLNSALGLFSSQTSPPFQVVAQRVNFWNKPRFLRKQLLELVLRKL